MNQLKTHLDMLKNCIATLSGITNVVREHLETSNRNIVESNQLKRNSNTLQKKTNELLEQNNKLQEQILKEVKK